MCMWLSSFINKTNLITRLASTSGSVVKGADAEPRAAWEKLCSTVPNWSDWNASLLGEASEKPGRLVRGHCPQPCACAGPGHRILRTVWPRPLLSFRWSLIFSLIVTHSSYSYLSRPSIPKGLVRKTPIKEHGVEIFFTKVDNGLVTSVPW